MDKTAQMGVMEQWVVPKCDKELLRSALLGLKQQGHFNRNSDKGAAMPYQKLSRDQHFDASGPKRILSLDGGGLRGIVTLGYLKRVEDLLRERHGGDEQFRLAHYFDLIAGTSTGSIIAAGLAIGMSVQQLTDLYIRLGRDVFHKSLWRKGILRARYNHEKLSEHLRSILGSELTLGSPDLQTGLLVMTKRMDTGSPWPLGNNPKGKFFRAAQSDDWISNEDFPLWQVVRASTAAPSYFNPEKITISRKKGGGSIHGEFVDGGVSPFNNPTLQAFMYATLDGYRVGWEAGAERLLIISVGTGRGDPGREPTWITAKGAMQSLLSLMDDSAALVETMAQWMSTGDTHRDIDGDMGTLIDDRIGRIPQFTYARYDLSFLRADIDMLKPGVTDKTLKSLAEMDEPRNMRLLKELADIDATSKIVPKHFPAIFDLA